MRLMRLALLTVLLVVALRHPVVAGLPEPEIILYGKVFNNGALVTAGTLRWTLTPQAGGSPVVVQVALSTVNNGFGENFSYIVQLPARTLISGVAAEPGLLNLADTPATFNRAATLNNSPLTLIAPAPAQVNLSSADRGRLERVDLLVAGNPPPNDLPPAAPQPVLPTNGLQGLSPSTVMLDWLDAAGATSYSMLFWRDGDPLPAAPNINGIAPSLLDLGGTLQPSTRYLWQVVAINAAGSTPGPRWSFTTQTPGSAQLAFMRSELTVFEQDGVARLDTLLQGTPAGPVRADYLTRETGSAVGGTNFTPQAGTLAYSTTQSAQRIDVPILNDGVARDDRSFEVLLRNVTNAAAPPPQSATVRIIDESIGSILSYLLGRTNNPNGLDRNNDGSVDVADIATQSNNLAPMQPANPQPGVGAQGIHPLPVLSWSKTSARDKSYQLYLWRAADAKPAQPTVTGLAQPLFTTAQPLELNTDYLWQVVAVGQSSQTDGPVWSFRTMEQPPVLVLSPNTGGDFVVGGTLNIQWLNRADAGTAVRLELWRNGAVQAVLGDGFSESLTATTPKTIPTLPPASDYRIRAISVWLESNGVTPNFDESDAPIRISAQ